MNIKWIYNLYFMLPHRKYDADFQLMIQQQSTCAWVLKYCFIWILKHLHFTFSQLRQMLQVHLLCNLNTNALNSQYVGIYTTSVRGDCWITNASVYIIYSIVGCRITSPVAYFFRPSSKPIPVPYFRRQDFNDIMKLWSLLPI